MSKQTEIKRITVPEIAARKGGEPLVTLTAYTARMAELLDPHCELLLVGDSLGNVIYGFDSTLPVTLDIMIAHTGAVVRGSESACVIADMPFGSYEESPEVAYRNAARIVSETGAAGIKLEGGVTMAPTIRFLVERGIPVMAHVGLRPQMVNVMGGFKTQGRDRAAWDTIIADAKAVEEAGAFSVVLEGVAEPLAAHLTKELGIVTIGIGASAACDGQILVIDDMLGMFEFTPKFVKRYGEVGSAVTEAVKAYAEDVRARRFPGEEQTYKMRD